MLILAGVTISVLNSAGILKNSQSAADKYEITDEQDVISVAFSTVFANSALNDSDITPEMLQKELDKTSRETTVRKSPDTGKENYLFVKFDKTKNEHSVDITNGKIDYIGPYSEITVDILKNGTIQMIADPTAPTNGNVTVTISYTLPEDKKGEKDKIVLEYANSTAPNTWTKYEQPLIIERNMTVYARLRYLTETTEKPASLNITNIDKLPPLTFTPSITPATNNIKVVVSTTDAPANSANACSGLAQKPYSFSKDGGKNWTEYQTSGTYTFDKLTQGTTYQILAKAKDAVGNEIIGGKNGGSDPIEITTPEITGKITFGNIVWTKTSNQASVTINVDALQPGCMLQISQDGKNWEPAYNPNDTTKQRTSSGPSGTTIYARIWDGINEGPVNNTPGANKYASITIVDNTPPATPRITNPTNQNWTNHDFSLTLASSDSQSGISHYQYSYDQTNWTTYANSNKDNFVTTPFTAERNQPVYIRCVDYVGNISGVSSTYIRIDKKDPTLAFSPNGGNVYTMPTTGNAVLKTKVTVSDQGGSGVCASSLQYVWSQSTTAPNSGWAGFTNDTTITKNNITQAGTWYLWIKYNDNARNNTRTAPKVERSNAFIVGANTDNANRIILTANRTDWVNQDITVTVQYGANLTQARTLGCNGTNGNDYTVNGTSNVIVKTNGKTVTASAKDTMGNMITASLSINNIDKANPTVSFAPNGGTYIKSTESNTTIRARVTVSDTGGSGIYAGSLKYAWTPYPYPPELNWNGWTTFSNQSLIQKTDITATGTWYLHVQYNDNARYNLSDVL